MSTINSFPFPYCTVAFFLERYDVRTVAQYLSDNNVPLTPIEITTSPAMLALLQEASGIVEAFVLKGTRYSVADLQLLANLAVDGSPKANPLNTTEMLYGIVAGITMFLVWERRPLRYAQHPMPMRSELAWEQVKALGEGAQIFGLLETAQAGEPPPQFMTNAQIFKRNFSSNQAKAYFGDRAQYQVPGP